MFKGIMLKGIHSVFARCLVVVALTAFSVQLIHADEVVNETTDAALRAAVAGGGTVTFSVNGVITLSSSLVITQNTTIDATGHTITLDGNAATRLIEISSNAQVTLTGLNLINGMDHPPRPTTSGLPGTNALGGAIWHQSGALTLNGCVLSNNVAWGGQSHPINDVDRQKSGDAYGGAIYTDGATLTLVDCTLLANQAKGFWVVNFPFDAGSAFGGAIAAKGTQVTIERCLVEGNNATGGDGVRPALAGMAQGGGLHVSGGGADVKFSRVKGNKTSGGYSYHGNSGPSWGGGIYSDGTLAVTDSIVIQNIVTAASSPSWGGGIYSSGSLQISRSSFAHNTVVGGEGVAPALLYTPGYPARGGGIATLGATSITNTTFLNNTALGGPGAGTPAGRTISGPGYGGGVFHSGGRLDITFATFALNVTQPSPLQTTGQIGEMKGTDIYDADGEVVAANSIFASADHGAAFGTITDGGYNIAVDNSAAFTAPTSLNATDPKLGIPTETYVTLTFFSPALDSADPAHFPATDQLGADRPAGVGPDRGAVEFRGLQITQFSETSPGTLRLVVGNRTGKPFTLQHSIDGATWIDGGQTGPATVGPHEFTVSAPGGGVEFWQAVAIEQSN